MVKKRKEKKSKEFEALRDGKTGVNKTDVQRRNGKKTYVRKEWGRFIPSHTFGFRLMELNFVSA